MCEDIQLSAITTWSNIARYCCEYNWENWLHYNGTVLYSFNPFYPLVLVMPYNTNNNLYAVFLSDNTKLVSKPKFTHHEYAPVPFTWG